MYPWGIPLPPPPPLGGYRGEIPSPFRHEANARRFTTEGKLKKGDVPAMKLKPLDNVLTQVRIRAIQKLLHRDYESHGSCPTDPLLRAQFIARRVAESRARITARLKSKQPAGETVRPKPPSSAPPPHLCARTDPYN